MRSIGTVPTVGFLVIACLALVLLCGCLPQRIKLNVVENQEAGAFCGQKDQNGKTVTYRCSDSLVCMNGTCSTGTDTTNVDPGDGDQGYETTAPSDSVNEHDIDNPDDLIIDAGLDSSPTVDSDSGTDLSVELDQLDAMDDLDALFLSDSGVDTYDTEIVPPIVTIESSPPALTADLQATFTFSCQQTSCTFECALDGGAWGACLP
ncbi:MAG: hypothetical protein KC609_19935, partial [Myxococcales bacterium]|nr:hypothetical protein [Myxococcales bacterium]